MRIWNLLTGVTVGVAVLLAGAVAQAQTPTTNPKIPGGWASKSTNTKWGGPYTFTDSAGAQVTTRLPPGYAKGGKSGFAIRSATDASGATVDVRLPKGLNKGRLVP